MTSPFFTKKYKSPSAFLQPSANPVALTDGSKKQGEKPVPKPRTRKDKDPYVSPLLIKSKVECVAQLGEVQSAPRPRPHSIHGEDSLKEYEVDKSSVPSMPPENFGCIEREECANLSEAAFTSPAVFIGESKKQGEKPVPKPRTKKDKDPVFVPRPRPHSIHGEDSLKEYELNRFGQISKQEDILSEPAKMEVDNISQLQLPPVKYDDHMSLVLYSIEPGVAGALKPKKLDIGQASGFLHDQVMPIIEDPPTPNSSLPGLSACDILLPGGGIALANELKDQKSEMSPSPFVSPQQGVALDTKPIPDPFIKDTSPSVHVCEFVLQSEANDEVADSHESTETASTPRKQKGLLARIGKKLSPSVKRKNRSHEAELPKSHSTTSFSSYMKASPVLVRKKLSVQEDKSDMDLVPSTETHQVAPRRLRVSSTSHVHSTRNPKLLADLLDKSHTDCNERNEHGDPPIIAYVRNKQRNRYNLLMTLVQYGRNIDVNVHDLNDNTALHIAAQMNDHQYIKILLAFDADCTIVNSQGQTALKFALLDSDARQLLQKAMQRAAVKGCAAIDQLASLPDGMRYIDQCELENAHLDSLLSPSKIDSYVHHMDMLLHTLIDDRIKAFKSISAHDYHEEFVLNTQRRYVDMWKQTRGSRILFLDGGGIRGLIEIEILMEIEKQTGRRIPELFDYMIGTSTGAVITLALVYGKKSLKELKQLYFRMKSAVFGTGLSTMLKVTQKTNRLEKILKVSLGEEPLSSIKHPKVMICAVNQEQSPLRVQFFNNFMDDCPELTEVPAWYAARASSATPFYFAPCDDKFIDGGVKANNPCEFASKVIDDYDRKMGVEERHIALAVSIGTGVYPVREHDKKAVFGKDLIDIRKQMKSVKHLIDLLAEALSESEMAADKFRVWCRRRRYPIPFFRFSPQLPEVISPAETDDEKLIEMMMQSKEYLSSEQVKANFSEMMKVLKQLQGNS